MHYEKFQDGSVKCIEDEIPFEIPQGWEWTRMNTLVVDLSYGTSKKSHDTGDVAVIRMGNLQNGEIDFSELVYSSDMEDIERYSLSKGDLLFNRTNSIELVGKTSIYRGDIPAIFAGYLIRIRTQINSNYLNAVMNSQYVRKLCAAVRTDAVNQSNINASKLGQFLIPIPGQAEQDRIAKTLQSILLIIDQTGNDIQEIKSLVIQAKSRILDLAIRGKLVPQDPDDEPASVLLERIRAEKEELIKQGKIKRDKKESVIFKGEDNSYYIKTGKQLESIDDWGIDMLPDNWEICCLGELCDYGNCINVETADIDDSAWILDLEDIEKDTGRILQKVTKRQRNSVSTKHRFHSGQVLYSKLRPYLNKVVLTEEDGYCTSEILPLDFAAPILPSYARYYLMSPTFLAYADRCSYGVKMPRLSTEDGKKSVITVPPLLEQQRIITAIENCFDCLNDIVQTIS